MRDAPNAKTDFAARLTAPARWRVAAVEPGPHWRIVVRFADGTGGTVDLTRLVFGQNAGVFESLRDAAFFARVAIEDGVVTWPGGLDLAPDAMYEAIGRTGEWVPE
jgi:hypothetical protein